jgi:recombination protein RecA
MASTEISQEKRKALNVAISQIERAHGKGSIMRMGSDKPREQVAAIPTGALSLDVALGIGGLPAWPHR